MPNIKCIGCGRTKLIKSDNISLQVIRKHGFNYVWNVSDGLMHEMLCSDCAEKVRGYIHAIEDIVKIEIGLLGLEDYSKYNIVD